jgi:predicted sulfurtransferase
MGKKRKLSINGIGSQSCCSGFDDRGDDDLLGSFHQSHAWDDEQLYDTCNCSDVTIVPTHSTSVAGRPLPPLPLVYDSSNEEKMGSILLFYQYKEPMWSETEFQKVLKKVLAFGQHYSITGRGRIATEGVNCTLTGSSPNIRAFCHALREQLDPVLFAETDFKITDGIPKSQMFKSLSMRKTDELVAYGLAHDKAPSIKRFGGTHLNAVDYHKALQDPNAVVIDVSSHSLWIMIRPLFVTRRPSFDRLLSFYFQVRNQYETAIGTIKPPPGGAKLIDPKLRNSHEWPKWLAAKETQQLLDGKKVMMFCTGGIRCERAAALVNQMAVVSSSEVNNKSQDVNSSKAIDESHSFQPLGVFHMQGGIERYLKTFPKGGYWSGKNYLFDKRMEQLPEFKDNTKVEQEVAVQMQAKCCRCRIPWTSYRGKYKCSQTLCGVPVLVCDCCHIQVSRDPQKDLTLQCELCRQGYRAPQHVPDLVALRLKAEKVVNKKPHQGQNSIKGAEESSKKATPRAPRTTCSDRLFLSRLPLNVSRNQIQEWLQTPIQHIHWLTDQCSGAFYGSCIVQIDCKALSALSTHPKLGIFPGTEISHQTSRRKRRKRQQPKVSHAYAVSGQVWPPNCETDFPPLGHCH